MIKNGQSLRIPCNSLCLLSYQGVEYQGMIDNVSLSGALVRLQGPAPLGIRSGDECGLMLCSDPGICPVRYSCRVIRIDSDCIGLEFVELG
jgi:hypothetical protein